MPNYGLFRWVEELEIPTDCSVAGGTYYKIVIPSVFAINIEQSPDTGVYPTPSGHATISFPTTGASYVFAGTEVFPNEFTQTYTIGSETMTIRFYDFLPDLYEISSSSNAVLASVFGVKDFACVVF